MGRAMSDHTLGIMVVASFAVVGFAIALSLDLRPGPKPRIATIVSTIYSERYCTEDYWRVWRAPPRGCVLPERQP